MARPKNAKLNNLMTNFPLEGVVTSAWLKKNGYYKQLVKQYCDSGWLVRLGNGAYSRLNDPISWQNAVSALQKQLQLPVHIGALSALSLYGVSQYVILNTRDTSFFLFNTSHKKVSLPAWFSQYFVHAHYYQKKLFDRQLGLTDKEVDGTTLHVSVPERAILEVLALTPEKISLQHAYELMENLNRLRSKQVQALLESCLSVKVKRLFLCLSDLYHLDFFHELDLSKINIGSGKRVIGQGGTYYSKWQLSLPGDIAGDLSVGE